MRVKYYFKVIFTVLIFFISARSSAQQFNSDNYITMPHGTGTFILTNGTRNANMYSVFSLAPRFELNFQATLFWEDAVTNQGNRFTTNLYGKYMFWVNKEKNGGAAVFLGVGRAPGYFTKDEYSAMHKNYWTALPLTIPIKNTVFWDIMPGALVDFDHGNNRASSWGFTWSTRVAVYKIIPKTAIVGEAYGTEGQVSAMPEYKAGLRWEPNSFIVVAGTYGAQLNGDKGAGFELGVMIFTPQFLKKDYLKNNTITY